MDVKEGFDLVVGYITGYGINVLGAIALLLVGRVVAAWGRRFSRKAMERAEFDATLTPFFAKAVYYLIQMVVVIAVLELFGVQATSLVAILGAAGLAVGLALQGTLSNFASGVMLLFFRPFDVGDWVEAGGNSGSVLEIGLFATTLTSGDNIQLIVPNSAVWGSTIINYNGFDTRRVDLVVGISYDDDIGKAMETIRDIVTADERVLAEPDVLVAVSNLGDSSVDLVVRPWCASSDYWPLRFDLMRRLKEGIEASGASFPYPQRHMHVRQVGAESS